MLVTTIWILLLAQGYAKDLAPHAHQQILNENVESRTRMAYYDSTDLSNPHYKINYIYEQRKTNEVTEIEQIEEEIGKYLHHHHQPPTMTTTTEAQQNIEVVNEKDIKETTNHSPSETPITFIEKHHHKHEEKEIASTLAPIPPAPKLQERYITVHPHFPAELPKKVKNELKELLAHELRRIPHRHPDHRLHISRTTTETPIELEARTELSPLVTQLDKIPNSDFSEAHLDHPDSPAHELRPIPHRHPNHWLHVTQTMSEAPVEEEARTELSPPGTQSDNIEEIPNNDVTGSPLDHPDFLAHELRPTPHRHPDHRVHISRTMSEAPVEVEAWTELSPSDTPWEEMKEFLNSDVPESHVDRPGTPAHAPRPIPHRHSDHRLHISRTTLSAPVDEKARTELSPPATQWEELKEIPNDDVAGSHLERPDAMTNEPRPIPHRHPDHRLHISRSTSEVPVEVEERTNHASTEKRIHLSPTSHDPSFLSRKDQNTLAKIRPKFEDVQHGSIGLPSRPRPVYRGSYKFSWDDINDMHASAVPKVSQLKENPNPPPVPTLSPWYDGYGK